MTENSDWRARIRIGAVIHHGDPCVAGTRVPVGIIVGSIAAGDGFGQILRSYPQLTHEDIQAALLFAAEAVNRFDPVPLSQQNR